MSSERKTNCNACGRRINSLFYMECCNCKELYDLECLSIPIESFQKLTDKSKESWICPTCACAKPKTGDTSTPIRVLNNTFTNNVNKTRGSRSKQGTPQGNDDDDLSLAAVIREISLMRRDVQTLALKIEDYDKKLESKDREIQDLKVTVIELQQKIEGHEQLHVKNDIEIIGVPEQSNENLPHITLIASKKLGVDLQLTDIDEVRRVGPRRPSVQATNGLKPRPVVVKFVRKLKRDEVLKAAKTRRNLTSEGIISGTTTHIYFNERLSNFNRQLFREARARSRLHQFSFCWIRNGNIFVRKGDNSNGAKHPAIPIRCQEDINNHIGTAAVSSTTNAPSTTPSRPACPE